MHTALTRIEVLGRACDRVLERFGVRLVLSIAIFASLLPIDWLERRSGVFFAVFAVEFALRALAVSAVLRPPRPEELEARPSERAIGRSRTGALALLGLDALALISFVPVPTAGFGQWLRVFRLTRLLALVGYWAPLVRDLWEVLARRERIRQLWLMAVVVAGLSFAGAVVLHQGAADAFDANEDGVLDERDSSFFVLLWWAFRQVQDPGNMLESPTAISVVLVSLVLTVFGLFLVSFLIGLGTDVVRELLDLTRLRAPNFAGHTVIVNITPATRRLLLELWAYYRRLFPTEARLLSRQWFADLRRRGLAHLRYVIVGKTSDPPEYLREAELGHVAYRARTDDEEELIARTDMVAAKRVLLLADVDAPDSDAETIRMLLTMTERVRARERQRWALAPKRTRAVIAEILDESNIAAARAALATAGTSFRGWVVPSEKMIGLYFAGALRRPGLGALLEILLASTGHDIYTCFFATPGLGFQVERPPGLGGDARELMPLLAAVGQTIDRVNPVIPIGVLVDCGAGEHRRDFDVVLNPPPGRLIDESSVRGLVGLADNFGGVRRWIDALARGPGVPPSPHDGGEHMPRLARTRRAKTTRVLVCGFRHGTLYLIEELFRSDPSGEVLVLVPDERSLARVETTLAAHTQLVGRGLMPGRHGAFESEGRGRGEFRVRMPEQPQTAGVLRLAVADWVETRVLVELPLGFGAVGELDAIAFVAGRGAEDDARTTTALLKLEQLCGRGGNGSAHRPSVVAEIFDDHLAARLSARARELGHAHVQVFSSQQLRAFLLFQSVVVPGFDAVWEELLGAWGQSIVHKHVVAEPTRPCTFVELSDELRRAGEILIAVELADGRGGVDVAVAPGPGERGGVFGSELRGAWVIAPDSGGPHAPRRRRRPAGARTPSTGEPSEPSEPIVVDLPSARPICDDRPT